MSITITERQSRLKLLKNESPSAYMNKCELMKHNVKALLITNSIPNYLFGP